MGGENSNTEASRREARFANSSDGLSLPHDANSRALAKVESFSKGVLEMKYETAEFWANTMWRLAVVILLAVIATRVDAQVQVTEASTTLHWPAAVLSNPLPAGHAIVYEILTAPHPRPPTDSGTLFAVTNLLSSPIGNSCLPITIGLRTAQIDAQGITIAISTTLWSSELTAHGSEQFTPPPFYFMLDAISCAPNAPTTMSVER